MSIEDISAEELAKTFFHYLKTLGADECSSESQTQSWDDVSSLERNRMIAAAQFTLMDIRHAKEVTAIKSNPYFANPGSAEWGC